MNTERYAPERLDQLAEELKGYGWKAGVPVWPKSQEPDIEHAQPLPAHCADPDACFGDQDEAVHDDNPGNKDGSDLQDGPGHSMGSVPAVHSIDLNEYLLSADVLLCYQVFLLLTINATQQCMTLILRQQWTYQRLP